MTSRPQAIARGACLTPLAAAIALAVLCAGLAACGGKGGGSPTPAATVTVTTTPTGSATPSPSPSASTKTQLVIACASGPKANAISVVSSTGQVKQLVPPVGGPIRSLAWSPDGRRLAYLQAKSLTDYGAALQVYDATSGTVTKVALPKKHYSAMVDSFAWVGADQVIEVVSFAPTYHANGTLFLRNLATGKLEPVRDSAGHVVDGVGVSASADGMHVAFVTYGAKSGATIPEKLRLLDANDLVVTTVATGEAPTPEDGDQFSVPLISPDGSLIYTLQTGSDIGFGCTVYAVTGAKALQTTGLVWPAAGSWTSHGTQLAFGGGNGAVGTQTDSLLTWKPRASKPTAILTLKTPPITTLAWSPKASQIAYSIARENGLQSALWVVNADGTNKHLLLGNGSWPAWAMAPISFP